MKLIIPQSQRFTCRQCSQCCRNWFVELSDEEVSALESLSWDDGNPLQGQPVSMVFNGKHYLRHAGDRACIFLDRESGLCRIHGKFGEAAKPRGCRLYPFHVRTAFPGEFSVTGRFDCPTIRENHGKSFAEQREAMESITQELGLKSGFTGQHRQGLKKSTIVFLVDFVASEIRSILSSSHRAGFLLLFSHALKAMGADFLNSAKARKEMKSVAERTRVELGKNDFEKPASTQRLFFRTLLSVYLRRDEDVIGHPGKRLRRFVESFRIVFGRGDFQKMGDQHPTGDFSRVISFTGRNRELPTEVVEVFWRMMDQKLRSYQFMGDAQFGQDFFSGLLSLSLLYPLTLTAADYHAAAMNRLGDSLKKDDLMFAVGCIEHSFGRHPLLQTPWIRFMESRLLDIDSCLNLIYSQ